MAAVQTFVDTAGIDYTLPTPPPLVDPPLALLTLSRTLINTEDLVEQLREANEAAASAQSAVADIPSQGDRPGEADDLEDADSTLEQMQAEWDAVEAQREGAINASLAAEAFASDLAKRVADLSRWEQGFTYLPELSNEAALEVFSYGQTARKKTGNNQTPFAWYDPFTVVGRDDRSAFGWPNTDFASRVQRARRALRAHRGWQVENEFWSGLQIPTNYHLACSPDTPLVTPRRTVVGAFPNPDPAPGTTLGTAVSLGNSLAALDQAIADSDAGTGMIHATPFLVQMWMKLYNYIRDNNGFVFTVNHNLIVPGYGYPGTGPDAADRNVADAVTVINTPDITSATAAFTAADLGRPLTIEGLPTGSVVGIVVSGTDITAFGPNPSTGSYEPALASASGTNLALTVSGRGGRASFAPQQWAYATDMVYDSLGDVIVYPSHLNQEAPGLVVNNDIEVRAEQNVAMITNKLLRAAVLVDTTTS